MDVLAAKFAVLGLPEEKRTALASLESLAGSFRDRAAPIIVETVVIEGGVRQVINREETHAELGGVAQRE